MIWEMFTKGNIYRIEPYPVHILAGIHDDEVRLLSLLFHMTRIDVDHLHCNEH
jgi:hypothetical protein